MAIVDSSTQLRVIRAFLGMDCHSFAARLGISAGTATAYEDGKTAPLGPTRQVLAKLCQEHGIGFLPSGMPVPFAECFVFNPGEFTGWDSPIARGADSAVPSASLAEQVPSVPTPEPAVRRCLSGGTEPVKRAFDARLRYPRRMLF
jgi:transcriptional regulator with XRE-family HTH domain